MSEQQEQTSAATITTRRPDHEVIVIGAGVGGIYQIKRLTDLGVDAIVLEGESDLGGTWYRNRYPGARFDSESYSYGFSFSKELLDEWHWKERFSSQPENLRYLNFVADKFDLRQYMRFDTKVLAMRFDEGERLWHLELHDGSTLTCRFVVTAIGLLSVPTPPKLEGMDSFEGQSFHTFHWPEEPIDLTDKRVAVIGTGATGIQVIGEIADKVGDLTVFQRRPNWSAPLNNSLISDEEMADIRERYDEIFAECAQSPGGFIHSPDRRGFYKFTREERIARWDELYDGSGFGIWLNNFAEIFVDEEANAEFSEYIADRIQQRVDDPEVAEKLIPRDHGFGVQRVPMETTTSRPTTATTCIWSTFERLHSSASRPPACAPPSATMSSTSSSMPPDSMRSPVPSTRSASRAPTGNSSPTSGATARPPSTAR
ncbi:MAG: NAD(P)/FAD-dependent oxidoreductase [Acidimicrobiales bacterium]